jgi:Polyketide cyclase / dehydrase and lipid transport
MAPCHDGAVSIDRLCHQWAVAAPPSAVYGHLADPHSYIGLSPLVVAVRDVRDGRDAQGRPLVSYVAVERFRAGPLRWDNPIRVTMTGAQPHRRLVSEVVSPGRVRLTATVDLSPDEETGGTAVTEELTVRSPWLLRRFVLGQARAVQLHRAAELARRAGKGF